MDSNKMDNIVVELFTIFPLINKKLFSPQELLQGTNLTITQFHILVLLEERGMMPTTELGKRLSILKSNTTPIINKLIKEELIKRVHSEEDKRYIYLDLTEKGKSFLLERKAFLQEGLRKKLSVLSEEDLYQFEDSLNQLYKIVSKINME